ncbi:hypothetical protein CDAR_89711 [Caerostris darwini]|uniref:Uncharacterized protein n=1 Tax=Caerostris darwini TaxID=1538125 RepID=A0AAV4RPU1_9ARAC|nr:hypothetical protein CDAR_89711 [Caerostris darwini]
MRRAHEVLKDHPTTTHRVVEYSTNSLKDPGKVFFLFQTSRKEIRFDVAKSKKKLASKESSGKEDEEKMKKKKTRTGRNQRMNFFIPWTAIISCVDWTGYKRRIELDVNPVE